ncbi:MAG: GTP cyclohydrolase I, partial [Nitrospiraceae bacterium]
MRAKRVASDRRRYERHDVETRSELQEMVARMLEILGEDPTRHGLVNTPERVEKMLQFMTKGYTQDIGHLLNGALFPIEYDEMVIVKDIDFFSL